MRAGELEEKKVEKTTRVSVDYYLPFDNNLKAKAELGEC